MFADFLRHDVRGSLPVTIGRLMGIWCAFHGVQAGYRGGKCGLKCVLYGGDVSLNWIGYELNVWGFAQISSKQNSEACAGFASLCRKVMWIWDDVEYVSVEPLRSSPSVVIQVGSQPYNLCIRVFMRAFRQSFFYYICLQNAKKQCIFRYTVWRLR